MTPAQLIARSILRERNRLGISLTALAQKADIAKSTLSQLEAGKGNPSIETLWNIANALGVQFSTLFERPEDTSKLVRVDDGKGIQSDMSDYTTLLLDKCPSGRMRDIYRVTLSKGAPRMAEPHPNGTSEHAVVISGRVRVGTQDAPEVLGQGDYYRFPADVPHMYEALSDTALMVFVMESPA